LLGKVKIARTDEDYYTDSEKLKKLTIADDMNILAYTEPICKSMTRQAVGK
jgi:hypothetical protein